MTVTWNKENLQSRLLLLARPLKRHSRYMRVDRPDLLAVGDLVRVALTGEMVHVTATSPVTVKRACGVVKSAHAAEGTDLVILANDPGWKPNRIVVNFQRG